MPLFTFKCVVCSKIIEKFIKDEKTKLKCSCGSDEFERQFVFSTKGKIWKNAQEYLENEINTEIEKIQKKMSEGDDNVFLDIAGE